MYRQVPTGNFLRSAAFSGDNNNNATKKITKLTKIHIIPKNEINCVN